MADPVGFEGANTVYYAPKGCDDVRDLECFADGNQVISCWRLTNEEIEQVVRTGVVWLSVKSRALPPVLISGSALVVVEGKPARAEPLIPKRKRGQ